MAEGLGRSLALISLAAAVLGAGDLAARSADGSKPGHGPAGYVVLFEEPPLATWLANRRDERLRSTAHASRSPTRRPARLDLQAPEARAYLDELDVRFAKFRGEARNRLGLDIEPKRRYRVALNGFSASLTPQEAKKISKMPGVALVERDTVHRLHTDSGPQWIGADELWNGNVGPPSTRGEGVVIGIIDSGVNWDHAALRDLGGNPNDPGQHNHQNPFGKYLGICDPDYELYDESVTCNDKLIGIYDFVEEDPDTETQEFSNGRDTVNHGTISASVAAGNPQSVNLFGKPVAAHGVAPNANIVSYRVCYLDSRGEDICKSGAILDAIEQAVTDGVDVINYSLGSSTVSSPWNSAHAMAYLAAFHAGIFVATSAGNDGPGDSTMGSPGHAPWMNAVGAATHDRLLANSLDAAQGGDTDPPGVIYGAGLNNQGLGISGIVHAKDFGNALCGEGEPESGPSCNENTGASNPFEPGTFNGEIVVCDRGTYGRVEKGFNVMQAGAGGFVLANTETEGHAGQIIADQHCLPATHINKEDGDALRAWLDSGTGHLASISGFQIAHLEEVGDQLSEFSSRGPNLAPVQDILKPNLIAPGQDILAASATGGYLRADGTSFSSPHVAGAAALLLSADPDLTPSMISSMLETTATAELATRDGVPATPHEVGAGRPRLDQAVNAGLFLDESANDFNDANPVDGGDPKTLNLPSMTNVNCADVCSFTRTLKPLVDGATWTATSSGFPEGVTVTVTPDEFTLSGNADQQIEVEIDLRGASTEGRWVYGQVRLNADGLPEAVLPVTLFSTGGELPQFWDISTDANGGWREFTLSDLRALPRATFTTSDLVRGTTVSRDLIEDPTWDDPFDGGEGVFTVLQYVPEDGLWLHARTLASDAEDIDLFVGLDRNGNEEADESELVCFSTTSSDLEQCDILEPEQGTWWVLVQNWEDGFDDNGPAQETTLITGVAVASDSPNLHATGPGTVPLGEEFKVRVSWENVEAVPGEILGGAVAISSSPDRPHDIGVIPVVFERTGVAEPATTALFSGRPASLALEPGQTHDRIFIDVPPGATLLSVDVSGDTQAQTDDLDVEIGRVSYDTAFEDAPRASPFEGLLLEDPSSATQTNVVPTQSGRGLNFNLSSGDLQPGRHYVVVTNEGDEPVSITVEADISFNGGEIALPGGLWQPASRPGINQGMEYNAGGDFRAVIWYTYGNDDAATWYISSGAAQPGNTWTSDLLRFTNDGAEQQGTRVGDLSMTLIGENDAIFTWTLFGESGSDRMKPISPPTCPEVDGEKRSYTGLWYRGMDGLGGASQLVNSGFQAQIHYLYDAYGIARWLYADGVWDEPEIPLYQWTGFCPLCEGSTSSEEVGLLSRDYASENTGSWTLDYVMSPPLMGDVVRTDQVVKLTDTITCQ